MDILTINKSGVFFQCISNSLAELQDLFFVSAISGSIFQPIFESFRLLKVSTITEDV